MGITLPDRAKPRGGVEVRKGGSLAGERSARGRIGLVSGVAALGGLFRRDKTLICPFKIA